MSRPRGRTRIERSGFTLIELLIAITMVVVISGAAVSLFRSQSNSLLANTDRYDLLQNARGALEGSTRMIRTMGAGTPGGQPVIVYGAQTVLAFNADYVERDTVDMRWAAYFNPQSPLGEDEAWDQASAAQLPNTSYTYPAATYRLANGALSPAETHVLFVQPDASTPRTDDFILYEQVNNGTPEVLARNILAHPNGNPFFQYLMRRATSGGQTVVVVSDDDLPLIRRPLAGATTGVDTANFVRPDSVRAVRLNFRVTNGRNGADERFRDISTTIEVPNNGIPLPTICGRPPIEPSGLSVVDTVPGSGRLWITWPASPDQSAGEHDVRQYILFRRSISAGSWSEPVVVIRAEAGKNSYTVMLSDNTPGASYTFGIAAQDCTPSQSPLRTVDVTASIGP
jgi:prepilin-type N-terminal cleavage/methylation domain-containing protein